MVMDVIKLTVIILQHIQIANHYFVHLKLFICQFYLKKKTPDKMTSPIKFKSQKEKGQNLLNA